MCVIASYLVCVSPFVANKVSHLYAYTGCAGAFKTNLGLSARIALGVLLAGVAQTHAPSNSSGKEWLFLPDHYYLGGLTYAAVMVIFAGARNVGGAIEQMWQIDMGVAIALLYNFLIFACVPMTQSELIHVQANLKGRSYDISLRDLGIVLPLILLFTFVIFISPMVADMHIAPFSWEMRSNWNSATTLTLPPHYLTL